MKEAKNGKTENGIRINLKSQKTGRNQNKTQKQGSRVYSRCICVSKSSDYGGTLMIESSVHR